MNVPGTGLLVFREFDASLTEVIDIATKRCVPAFSGKTMDCDREKETWMEPPARGTNANVG